MELAGRQIVPIVSVLALICASVVLGFQLWPAEDTNDTGVAVTTVREDRGPPAVAAPGAQPEPPLEFQMVKGAGFDTAPTALPSATALMPFPVALPTYLPQGVQLWNVAATLFGRAGDRGSIELYYTLPPDGTDRPAVHIIQSAVEGPSEITPPPEEGIFPLVAKEGGFTAQGLQWRYKVLAFPKFSILAAETTTAGGVWVEADIRVIGMNEDAALTELRRVLDSLR